MLNRIERIFRDVLDDDNLVVNDDLSQDTLSTWDSLAQIKLIMALEEEFSVKFQIEDVIEASSVGAIRSILQAKGVQ